MTSARVPGMSRYRRSRLRIFGSGMISSAPAANRRIRAGSPRSDTHQKESHRPAESTRRASMPPDRSEEHTSELQSLMRTSYAVFCLKKKNKNKHQKHKKYK